MGRKRKLFLGTEPIGGKVMKSRRKARFVTSQYHNIRNEISAIDNNSLIRPDDKDEKKKLLNERLEAIGGVDKYQQASIISTSHFKTSRWVVSILEQLGCRKTQQIPAAVKSQAPAIEDKEAGCISKNFASNCKLNVLEVGAINVQLQQCRWLNVRSIDVNSQHPSIEECDFFDIEPTASFDAVVCSMVSSLSLLK
jgi:25S rRNA (adenine2142-N1)-methyltransferase